ncbi:Type II secretion system (T2SS), protein F [Georgenia satyanarayanai]|uniref:Type II secretion system (T2SS), protein F n=1 Tax=Georgenia satyanarayanai TaxID=860221 RepID=A0A2Y9A4F2_9MICO|nr:type II secretion system F family protein [Georgenia satyanarayanai]PYG01132.1 type II secretion system (T2SS) protein F [Georgenia satyanarayanai]SSA39371.1 Type II secretion system (T2SS), protein F [Georgenia satyanarayanai]
MSAVLALAAALAVVPWLLTRPGAPRPARGRRRRQQRTPAVADAVVLLDLLDVALASGASVPGALAALAVATAPDPVAAQLRSAATALRLGATWQEAWQPCPPVLRPLASALEPGWTEGVDPCPLVRQAAASIRSRRRQEAQEAAARLGARLVLPLGLCFLPAFVLLAMAPVLLSGVGSLLAR